MIVPHLFTENAHAFSHWYESPGATERFPKAVPARCSRLLARCLSHLRLWEREVPNSGSSLDHGNTPLLEGSRLKGSKPPSPDRGFHTCKGTELRTSRTSLRNSDLGKRNLSLLSRRGSVTTSLPARARRRLCRQGRYSAAIQTHSSLAV